MSRLSLLLFSFLFVFINACSYNQTTKNGWKFTKKQYYSYINTPVVLDLDETVSVESYELALSSQVRKLDENLNLLIRSMENSDVNPNQEWAINITSQFPWLTGVVLTNNEGVVRARYPEYSKKELNIQPLLEVDPKQNRSFLRSYVEISGTGATVYLAKPVYVGNDFRGLVTVYFDPRQLVLNSGSISNHFVMLTTYGVLWPSQEGGFGLGSINWKSTLLSQSSGVKSLDGKRYYWTTRYIGNMPIVYAIPINNSSN